MRVAVTIAKATRQALVLGIASLLCAPLAFSQTVGEPTADSRRNEQPAVLSTKLDGVQIDRIGIEFEGKEKSSVFSDEQLREVVSRFEGRLLTAEDLTKLRQGLTSLYVEAGYLASGAVIKDQPVRDNTLVVTIVEGHAPEVQVSNARWFRKSYVEKRLEAGYKKPLTRTELEHRLRDLHLDPRIRRFDAELRPGRELGQSVLNVSLEEEFPIKFSVDFNNYQSPTVGSQRALIHASHQNVTGYGDQLRVVYGRSSGVNPLVDASYSLPLNRHDTTVSLAYRKNDFLVIEESFRSLDVESQSDIYSVGLRHPLLRRSFEKKRPHKTGVPARVTRELAIGVTGEHLRNRSFLLGEPFSFSAGADNGRSAITALRFFQEYTSWKGRQVFAFRSRFSFGLDLFNATIHNTTLPEGSTLDPGAKRPDSRFISWLGQFQLARRFDLWGLEDMELYARADVQWANDPLLSLEQLPIGGRYSVRGHRENELVRDKGFITSVELRMPIVQNRPWARRLDLVPFVDQGVGTNQEIVTFGDKAIASVGVGLRWSATIRRPFRLDPTFEVYWGALRINRSPNSGDGLQNHGLHFQVSLGTF